MIGFKVEYHNVRHGIAVCGYGDLIAKCYQKFGIPNTESIQLILSDNTIVDEEFLRVIDSQQLLLLKTIAQTDSLRINIMKVTYITH
jgi:hypothetical protein